MTNAKVVFIFLLSVFLFETTIGQSPIDSLQAIIKEKLGKGETDFLDIALKHDSLAILKGDLLTKAKGKNFLGMAYYLGNKSEQAVAHYVQALDLFTLAKDDYFTALCLNNLGAAIQYRGDPIQVINYYKKALVIFTKIDNQNWMASVTNNIAVQYIELKKFDEAILYTLKAKATFEKLKDTVQIATMVANLASIYIEKGESSKSITYAKTYLTYDSKYKQRDVEANVYNVLGDAYFAHNDYKNAEASNELSINLREANGGEYFHLRKNYHLKSKILEKTNRPLVALQAYKRYMTLQDSIYDSEKDERITRLTEEFETKYETKQKKAEAAILGLKLKNAKSDKLLIGLILSSALLISFLSFFYYTKRLKYKQTLVEKENVIQAQTIRKIEQENKLLALNSMIEGQEAERLRIAQDLHDGLGGLLTTVKAHFNSIQREMENIKNLNVYDKTNQLIDEACVEVRRIAHNMVPHSIKISGLKGALQDLKHSIDARGLHCDLEIIERSQLRLDDQKSNMVYRIIQEITNNAIKHSEGKKIFIQLLSHIESINITIEDDGKGFDINSILNTKGIGLKSIDSRVKYLNGTINYDSSPNHGTTVNIEIKC